MLHRSTPVQIIISGDPKTCPTAADMIAAVDSLLLPQKVLILADGNPESILYKNLKILAEISKTGENNTSGDVTVLRGGISDFMATA